MEDSGGEERHFRLLRKGVLQAGLPARELQEIAVRALPDQLSSTLLSSFYRFCLFHPPSPYCPSWVSDWNSAGRIRENKYFWSAQR